MSRTISAGSAMIALDEIGEGPPVVFLHAGVTDRRSWAAQLTTLACTHRSLAYDRRGFGSTTFDPDEPFRHLDDLGSVLADGAPAILVGNSQGGRIAIDFALREPGRVAALILVGTAVSGWIVEPTDLTAQEVALDRAIERAEQAGDLDRVNALEAWMWLDGPASAEGRVPAPVRDLFLQMNGDALRHPPATSQQDPPSALARLHEIVAPTLVIDGSLDLGYVRRRSAHLAAEIPNARHETIPGVAHLPALEAPDSFNRLLLDFVHEVERS